ncbi:zinc finger protein OZF-like isoform X2 [Nymphalis io]|uniref:zinc finger protein OZF-like isoform X2 n=1 Tax=Inachis io TaxID=171585 RepID=UPI0021691005|nr:zinc finger protein OZF-like isoform X2 [Nymphalis io]
MAADLKFNFNDYSLNGGGETRVPQDKICISCLKKEVPFINLSNCVHAKVFDFILDCKSNYLKTVNLYTQNLQFSNIEINSTIESQPIEFQILEPTTTETFIHIETEVKIERKSDNELDIPLIELQKEKKRTTISKAKTPLQKKYEGKIRIIMLSEDEMLDERKDEALKKSYLKLPFKCEFCITGFDHELTLKNHMEKRHCKKSDGIECKICFSILGTKTSYDEHYKRHFRRYECVECGRRNNNVYTVLKHYNESHGRIKTKFSCKLCDFSTESHRVYRYHRDKHRTKKVECELCGNSFVNNAGLKIHMFTVHRQSSRVYSCDKCGKVYRAKSGLAAHAAKHSPAAPAYCADCGTHFQTHLGLKYHLKHHSRHSDKRFACNECDAKFIVKRSLQDHIDWMHLNNTEHACNKCTKVFINSASLKKHREFVHEKKRPPRNKICDHCGRGFTSLSILRSHIRTHTGERPLQCAQCPATFAHSAALYTHNKLLHAKT